MVMMVLMVSCGDGMYAASSMAPAWPLVMVAHAYGCIRPADSPMHAGSALHVAWQLGYFELRHGVCRCV